MRKVLVTGGAGFIGSHLVRALVLDQSLFVVNLDALTYAGDRELLADLEGNPRHLFVHGNICDRALVRSLLAEHRPRAVIQLAAETHVDRSIDAADVFVKTNVNGTFELLEAARVSALGPDFRFINVSTDEVYGSLGATGTFSESSPLSPSSPYAASKASADCLVNAYFRTHRLPSVTLRCCNNYGPRQFPEKLMPLALLNALEGKPVPIYGDGLNVRDWIYVSDHVDAIVSALERGRPGETYVVGARTERTNLDLVHALLDTLEAARPARENAALGGKSYRDLVTFVADRPGHDRRYAVDPRKAEAELGFHPKVTLADGLRRTLDWYLGHEQFVRRINETRYARQRLGLGGAPA